MNLLGNALKFTTHGTVRLSLSWRGGMGSFRVEDTGPGIPAEEQVQIFAAFHQTALGHTSGGTGLGLHISQALVALLGGQIRALISTSLCRNPRGPSSCPPGGGWCAWPRTRPPASC